MLQKIKVKGSTLTKVIRHMEPNKNFQMLFFLWQKKCSNCKETFMDPNLWFCPSMHWETNPKMNKKWDSNCLARKGYPLGILIKLKKQLFDWKKMSEYFIPKII